MPEEVSTTPPRFQFLSLKNSQGESTPFLFRPGTSDEPLIKSVFQSQEYFLPVQDFQPKLILDCGGNIGCAAIYYTLRYPDAQIYSIEPSKTDFGILSFNTSLHKNLHAINSALWDKETFIRVEDKGGVSETPENESGALETVTISKLLRKSGFEEIDLLKIDIEGAEKEVFSAPDVDEWLSKVKVLTIKLHDKIKDDCSYEFFRAVSKYHWHFEFRGENLIFIRKS